jgi:hypothetical protein
MCACVWGGWKGAAKFKRYKDRNGHRDCESPANSSGFTLHLDLSLQRRNASSSTNVQCSNTGIFTHATLSHAGIGEIIDGAISQSITENTALGASMWTMCFMPQVVENSDCVGRFQATPEVSAGAHACPACA